MISSTDCIGFFAKEVDDIDLLMQICAGQDAKDLTTLPDYYGKEHEFNDPVKTIGIVKDFDNDSVTPAVRNALRAQVEKLREAGNEVIELEMPVLRYALPTYYITAMAEISSNLSRHDGIRYGFRSNESSDLASLYGNTRNEGFMPENKRRIMIGNFVLSSGFYDAYYLKAAKARTLIIEEYAKAFQKCDFLLTPVAPSTAFKLGEKTSDPVAMYLEDVLTVPVSLAGLPGLTIPVAEDDQGLPIGLQLIGPRRSDKSLLKFAAKFDQSSITGSTKQHADIMGGND